MKRKKYRTVGIFTKAAERLGKVFRNFAKKTSARGGKQPATNVKEKHGSTRKKNQKLVVQFCLEIQEQLHLINSLLQISIILVKEYIMENLEREMSRTTNLSLSASSEPFTSDEQGFEKQ